MKVRAVAAQFLWTFDYLPDDYDPVTHKDVEPLYTVTDARGSRRRSDVARRPDASTCTSQSPDVIHAFYVPQFLFKRDVVPGPGEQLRVHAQ